MVDYDTAVAAVQDPNADPAFLAKIAYENPEFGANVAAHQRAYPGLIRWLAQFGDDRARQIVIQRGYAVPETAVAPHEQPAQDSPAQDSPVQERQFAQEQQPIQEQLVRSAQEQPAVQDYQAQPVHQAQPIHQNQPITDTSTEYLDPYTNPADLSEVADYAEPVQEQPQPQPQQPIARNPYGFTAQMALTTTDQMQIAQIAQIAQYAPELRACIARNPNTYPALLEWLAQLNDPAINAALRTRQ